ncbi:MAG: hypothetical protein H0U53_11110 [Actinobacteria bacterium]|nr:hypothetical protein [Actinomycetota bacterium]
MTARLTEREALLLKYPPRPFTWVCGRKYKTSELVDGEPFQVEYVCTGINPGTVKVCGYCRRPKRPTAVLLWPAYLKACEKAGTTPRGSGPS